MFHNSLRPFLVAGFWFLWQTSVVAKPIQAPLETAPLHDVALPGRSPGQQAYEAPTQFAFSPDGRTLAIGAENYQLQFWDVRSGKQKRGIAHHLNSVYEIHYSPDGRLFATGTSKLVGVSLWDARSGKLIRTLKEPYPLSKGAHVFDFAFSRDGKTIAAICCGDIQVWDVATGRLRRKLKAPKKQWALSVSPDGRSIAAAGELEHNGNNETTKTVMYLWDIKSARLKKSRTGAGWPVNFMPDGRSLITRLVDPKNDNKVGRWTLASNRLRSVSSDRITANGDATPVAISPNGRLIATGHQNGTIRLRSVRSGTLLQTVQGGRELISGLAFSPDGSLLISAGYKARLKFWRVRSLHR